MAYVPRFFYSRWIAVYRESTSVPEYFQQAEVLTIPVLTFPVLAILVLTVFWLVKVLFFSRRVKAK
jgi:hypothetical protein